MKTFDLIARSTEYRFQRRRGITRWVSCSDISELIRKPLGEKLSILQSLERVRVRVRCAVLFLSMLVASSATAPAVTLLAAPSLSGPANGATGISTTPTFSWSSVSGADRYWITLSTNSADLPTDPAATSAPGCVSRGFSGNVGTTSYTAPNAFPYVGTPATLSPNTTYYWRVQGWKSGGSQGNYSSIQSFTTAPAVTPTISVTSPNGGENWVAGSAHSITWTASNTGSVAYFKVALSTDGGVTWPDTGGGIDLTPSGIYNPNAGSYSWTIPSNLAGSSMRIRVRAMDAAGYKRAESIGSGNFTIAPTASQVADLTGRVFDQKSNLALANATITLASTTLGTFSRTTDTNGYYAFTSQALGTYTLSASLAGYTGTSTSVSLSGAATRNLYLSPNFTINPTATLSGTVTDSTTGAPLAGQTVTLGVTQTAVTDSSGRYSFPSFASGVYTVSVNASGYLAYYSQLSMSGPCFQAISLQRNQALMGPKTYCGYSADPVNVATGNYVFSKVDLKLPGPGFGFSFERNYNAQDASSGTSSATPLGYGWTHSYYVRLVVDGSNNVTILWGDGRAETYNPDGNGGFSPQQGVGIFDTLTSGSGGAYSLRKKDQTVYAFDGSLRLASITDKNGNTLSLAYTGSNLTTITDTAGRSIGFTYDGSSRLTKITDPIARTIQFGYDANGNQISSTDANGKVTQYTYDGNHQMLTMVDPRGNTVVTNTYDAANRVVTAQKDAKQGQTSYEYNETARKTTVTQPLGRVTTYYYDIKRRLTRQDDANGNSVQYGYDDAGNRTLVTNKNGITTNYSYDTVGNVTGKTIGAVTTQITYDAKNNPLTRVDELGQVTNFTYDSNGNLIQTVDVNGGISKVSYTANGLPQTLTDPLNHVTTFTYDQWGNLATKTGALNNVTQYTYDGAGRQTAVQDALNRTSRSVYDNNDNLVSGTDAALQTTSYTYDGNNNRTSATDKRGKSTFYSYDVKDLLTTSTDALGHVVTTAYDALDQKIAVTDARGGVTHYAYDPAGNLVSGTDAMGKATQYTYDPNGNRWTITDPLGNTTRFFYDEFDRLIETDDPLGNKNKTDYDSLGRRMKVTDANGKATTFAYDPLGHLTKVTDANGGIVSYTYDPAGNRLSMTDPNGHRTTYTYDALNRLIQINDPSGGITVNTYDAVGNLASRKDANGKTVTYTYDAMDRRTGIAYPSGAPVSFTYDANGNRIGMTDGIGSATYQFDNLNRMTSATDAFGKTVGYAYDANGNRASMTYPGNKTVTYGYDANNRMASITDWLPHTTSYAYDDAGHLTGATNPNGTSAAYTFDTAGRVTALANSKGATAICNYALTLDPVGNHTQCAQNEPLQPVLPPQNIGYTYDTDNRLTASGTVTCAYDANGNLTARRENTFAYDFENRLIQSTINGVDSQYQYDGLGNRMAVATISGTQRYVVDTNGTLSHVLAVTDRAGTVSAYYVYGRGLVSSISSTGDSRYYHYDVRGSTIALSDSTGKVTDQYAYDPFGKLLNSNETTENPFRYIGRQGIWDDRNGLCYIRARYYAPNLGRFITKDPMTGTDGDSQSLHRYVYALNNPIRFVDINGFFAWDTFGIGVLQYIGGNAQMIGGVALNGFAAATEFASTGNYLALANGYLDMLHSVNDGSRNIAAGMQNALVNSFKNRSWTSGDDVAGVYDEFLDNHPILKRADDIRQGINTISNLYNFGTGNLSQEAFKHLASGDLIAGVDDLDTIRTLPNDLADALKTVADTTTDAYKLISTPRIPEIPESRACQVQTYKK